MEVKSNEKASEFKPGATNVSLVICRVNMFLHKKMHIPYMTITALNKCYICIYLVQYLPHLKHILCHFSPPATRSSAAYTDLPHLGHLGFSTGLKGISKGRDYFLDLQPKRKSASNFANQKKSTMSYHLFNVMKLPNCIHSGLTFLYNGSSFHAQHIYTAQS